MPLLFIGSGLVLILTGLKGKPDELWKLLQGDFTGANNFVYWLVSLLALGSLGYIPQLKNLSRLFIALVVIVLLLDNKGFFAKLQEFISTGGNGTQAGTGNAETMAGAAGGGLGQNGGIPDPFQFKWEEVQ